LRPNSIKNLNVGIYISKTQEARCDRAFNFLGFCLGISISIKMIISVFQKWVRLQIVGAK
ncbi:TPA: hypothetical protein ACG77S_002692, partial [Enterococcus faecium]